MSMKNALNEIYSQRENFIIIGLTGRNGSGCSKAADFLSKKIECLKIIGPSFEKNPDNNDRKKQILYNFAKKHWQPFFIIQARDIITSFILECTPYEIDIFLKDNGVKCGINSFRETYEKYYSLNKCLDNVILRNFEKVDDEIVHDYLKTQLPSFTEEFKNYIEQNSDKKFIPIYQKIGDNIRKNGIALSKDDTNVEHIYAIAQRINLVIKVLRKRNKRLRDQEKYSMPKDYFVIDAFRNPIEVLFFQERYAAFYLMAINTPNEDRIDRLRNEFDLSPSMIEEIDNKEYPKSNPLKN
jgi:hypothetical protein